MKLNNRIICHNTESGIKITFRNREFCLKYPLRIWKAYPPKARAFLIDNVTFLQTIDMPLVSDIKKISYNTSRPIFYPLFRDTLIKNTPQAVEDYKPSTPATIKKFLKIKYNGVSP